MQEIHSEFSLTPAALLAGYARGIFPMADSREGEIHWFRPEERGILEFSNLRISRSLRKVIRDGGFRVTYDTAFPEVMRACANRDETWISQEIEVAYSELHRLGNAHSVEVWHNGELAGGLYGVSLGGAFFGESMFHRMRDASKVALVYLVLHLRARGYLLLDTQYITDHLQSLGAHEIARNQYERILEKAVGIPASFCESPDSGDLVVPFPWEE